MANEILLLLQSATDFETIEGIMKDFCDEYYTAQNDISLKKLQNPPNTLIE
jgi:hypothetical protein